MNTKLITRISIGIAAILLVIITVANFISFSNEEITLRTSFKQKYDERTAFYDGMYKTLSGKSQVALKNDSSFRENVNIIMSARKDAPQLFMKWVTESNPNANYSEVSALYKDLSRAIEAKRDGFFVQEKFMQDIVMQHSNLILKFPGSLYNIFMGRKPLEYKPITSTLTDNVMRTGTDDNIKVF